MGSGIWRRSSLIAEVRSEDEPRVALLHLDAEQPVVLEGSGAVIWDLIDGQRTVEGIVAELEIEYGAGGAEMAAQVSAFLDNLAVQSFIELSPGGAGS